MKGMKRDEGDALMRGGVSGRKIANARRTIVLSPSSRFIPFIPLKKLPVRVRVEGRIVSAEYDRSNGKSPAGVNPGPSWRRAAWTVSSPPR